ncbi:MULTISPECIES: TIGR02757 family protein [unclassified Campylobacter]|uniref:TIGR02757 family protein n=1 Tax=unclassified Campylobacter TaxID=2593542 RepID=UPI00163CA8FC|nr:TIGR02757 family protein [Campylobacter sp. MIT 12-8780]
MLALKKRLEHFAREKNTLEALALAPDPLQIAKVHQDELISLICALFAYGNAKNIVNFLQKLDFSVLKLDEKAIKSYFSQAKLKYRFENSKDIEQIFITLRRFVQKYTLKDFFTKNYQEKGMIYALKAFIDEIYRLNPYRSYGYEFFFSKSFLNEPKSPLKRYNMYLRWMVRKDALDMGLFDEIKAKDLFIPLDTHTHKVALKLKLMQRKNYDFKAVLELTQNLRQFDPNDPIKYDFALYRLGQSREYMSL